MARLIGIDPGGRRIGVAVGDEDTGMAFPRPAVRADVGAAERIRSLAAAEGASRVVVGLPLNMDGSEGAQAAAARGFGARLLALGLDVVFSDERLTTWDAERLTRSAARRSMPDAIDSAAAALILEQYLAARRRRPEGA